jgi:hypothetical protein
MEGGQREVQLHFGLKKENMNDEKGGIWWGEGLSMTLTSQSMP